MAAAAAAFVEHGYQRTQMDDIAAALGLSKGTLYRSVESKESLLAAVLTYADHPETLPPDCRMVTAPLDEVSSTLRNQLARAVGGLELAMSVTGRPDADIRSEIESIVIDLYTMMAGNRVRIMVLDRCANELFGVIGDWYQSGRYAVVDLWVDYLNQRTSQIRSSVDHDVLARTIVELITLWAVKMPWDPAPRPYPTDMARLCAAMVANLLTGDQT